jgi:ribosome-associated protein YbcJ (S4-like RNA binding protein)
MGGGTKWRMLELYVQSREEKWRRKKVKSVDGKMISFTDSEE